MHKPVRLCVYGLGVESTAKYTDWTVNSIPCASHGSITAAVGSAALAAAAAETTAAALARVDDRRPRSASMFGAAARRRAAEDVWRQLDAPGRELLTRLSARRATGAEMVTWRRLCADTARMVINRMTCPCAQGSNRACAHKQSGIRAAACLEQGLSFTEVAPR